MKQLSGSKSGKEYDKAVNCHSASLAYMQVHHGKCQAGWSTSWNQDCWKKHQPSQICRWYHSNGRNWRGSTEPFFKKNLLIFSFNIVSPWGVIRLILQIWKRRFKQVIKSSRPLLLRSTPGASLSMAPLRSSTFSALGLLSWIWERTVATVWALFLGLEQSPRFSKLPPGSSFFLNSGLASLTNASICQGARRGLPCLAAGSGHLQRAGRGCVMFCCVLLCYCLCSPLAHVPGPRWAHTLPLVPSWVFFHDSIKAASAVRRICFWSRAHCHIVLGQEWREEGSWAGGMRGLKHEETSHVCLRSGWSEARPMGGQLEDPIQSPGKAAWGLQGRRHGWCWGLGLPSVQAWVLHGSIYSFLLIRSSCLLSAGVLPALLCLNVYSWCIHEERCPPCPPTPLPSCSPRISW